MENKKKNIEEKCLEQALKAGLKDRGETKRILQELVGEEIERLNTRLKKLQSQKTEKPAKKTAVRKTTTKKDA